MSDLIGTAPAFYKTLVGYRQVGIEHGDTLLKIAVRELQDASQWSKIAAINGLVPPYITDDPASVAPGVVLSGSKIFVPSPAPNVSAVSDASDVMGIDIQLVGVKTNGDFVGSLQTNGAGDLATVSGEANYEQAIYNRLATRPGDLIYHLSYGNLIYTLLGKWNGPAAGTLGASWLSQALLADPRTSSVQDAVANISADAITFSITAVPVTGKHLPVGTAQQPGG